MRTEVDECQIILREIVREMERDDLELYAWITAILLSDFISRIIGQHGGAAALPVSEEVVSHDESKRYFQISKEVSEGVKEELSKRWPRRN